MEEKNSDDLIYEEVKRRMADQLASISALDSKAALTLTFVGAIIAGLVNSSWFLKLRLGYHLCILVSLTLTGLLALGAAIARGYRGDPDPNGLILGYAGKSEKYTKGQLTRNYQEGFNKNATIIKRKYFILNAAFAGMAISVLILSASILLSLHKSTHKGVSGVKRSEHSTRTNLYPGPARPIFGRPNYQGG